MKDQVDNLEKAGITEAVTINGLLDPIERAKSFERIEEGSASILYISPESLRSRSISNLMLKRKISRFVIDEAHCFSAWGQDFRVDYLYIADFIKELQAKKELQDQIPISCFTATAKQNVIDDITNYFKEKLNIDLVLYKSSASRTNLKYQVFMCLDENEKYSKLRNLIESRNCPTIVYVSRTMKAVAISGKLNEDGFKSRPFHGKMDSKDKTENQNDFINGKVNIIVATSAFGMGVDKKDVGLVIHYEISNSLENYVQEAGRAGRDENITAECFILYNEEDLDKHFILLNQTKLSIKEIQQIWKAIKELTRMKTNVSKSALEIARKAGWDENVNEIETRVRTAITALAEAGYLSRGQNSPRIYANSILVKSAQEAVDRIEKSDKLDEKQKIDAIRIIKKLFSSKHKKLSEDENAESRVDYISDYLGIVTERVIAVISALREERILADKKDLSAFLKKGENKSKLISNLNTFRKLEEIIIALYDDNEVVFSIKEINSKAEIEGLNDTSTNKVKMLLNFLSIKNLIKRNYRHYSTHHVQLSFLTKKDDFIKNSSRRYELSNFILNYLIEKNNQNSFESQSDYNSIEFSVFGLLEEYLDQNSMFKKEVTCKDIEEALFFLSRMDLLNIEGGFLVVYNKLNIERLESNNKIQYKNEDYKKLAQFYSNKIQQVHIVGEYATKMIEDYSEALRFVDDYFQLNYNSFIGKYFKGSRQDEITRNLTPSKFKKLFGSLSPRQLSIIKDSSSSTLVVAAGPGSGKTKVLVHKLASVLMLEDIKNEQLLMLTFSRFAATEFKKRLIDLVGNVANFVEIKTFHSYCFDILGKVGSIDESNQIIKTTVDKIKNGEIELNRITKLVLVIDEAQDMTTDEFELIQTIIGLNEEIRVIAVGDDDQNIYDFRGSDSSFFYSLINTEGAKKIELVENFRSRKNLVEFSNDYVSKISKRMKNEKIYPISNQNGKINLIRHNSNNLITATVENIKSSDLSGSVVVLTRLNEEAVQIAGLLNNQGYPARLIQSLAEFKLERLAEIRFFHEQINAQNNSVVVSEELWQTSIERFKAAYKRSALFSNVLLLLNAFASVNNKIKYKSDFETFLNESKLEDFINYDSHTIIVSTIHKAKGKEFDNVYLLLNKVSDSEDSLKREIYVAITRARNNISIHYNTDLFENINQADANIFIDTNKYDEPKFLTIQLKHDDVWLDYFIQHQQDIEGLMSGDPLDIDEVGLFIKSGEYVLRFSKKFIKEIEDRKSKGFYTYKSIVTFNLYWKKNNSETEYRIILPQITFIKGSRMPSPNK